MIIPDDGTTEEYREAAHHWQEKWRQADADISTLKRILIEEKKKSDVLATWMVEAEQKLAQVMRERDEARAKHQALSGAVNRLARAISQT